MLKMQQTENQEVNLITSAQKVLIQKTMGCMRILDDEYNELKEILESQVITTYDGDVFIKHLLGAINFRRTFFADHRKAYKKCYFCKSRDEIVRFDDVKYDRKLWLCSTCEINYNTGSLVPVKVDESSEVTEDNIRKRDYSPEQEAIDEDARHGLIE